jgi:hypothetical protein
MNPSGAATVFTVITAVITRARRSGGVRAVSTASVGPLMRGVNAVATKRTTTTAQAARPSGRSHIGAMRSSERLTDVWLERGFRELLAAIVHEDLDWLAVQLEAVHRLRTDEAFRRRLEEHDAAHAEERAARLTRLRDAGYRDDVPLEEIARFLGLVANGLALRATVGDPLPDLDVLAELVERGVGAEPRKRAAPRRSVRATPRRS